MTELVIKKLAVDAFVPTRATNGSAGYDLYSYDTGIINGRSKAMIDTKISISIPKNHCGLIWPRSGLSAKYGIETGAGVIDSDYTGEIKVILHNHSNENFLYEKGMRLAQILIMPVITPKIVEFKEVELPDVSCLNVSIIKHVNKPDVDSGTDSGNDSENERNNKGFGSSGLF
jgi:dUTP pyrophosphatase